MTAKLFAWILAGALMVPQAALGKDLAGGAAPARSQSAWSALPLPPIPHLDTIPWLAAGGAEQRQKVDILLGPRFENVQLSFDPRPSLQSRDAAMKRN